MNILYIGAGFVGACSAAVSASSGHKTLVYDIDEKRVKMLGSGDRDTIESCLFEEGLGDILVRNKEKIEFTADYKKVGDFLDDCDAVFLCLPTPEIGETGESNLSYFFAAAEKLAKTLAQRNRGAQEKYVVVVNKSTVPIDMVDQIRAIMEKYGAKNYGLAFNPEFLIEGKAIQGSLKPSRVVVGAEDEKDFVIMRQVYQRFYNSPTVPYIEVGSREAAAGKLLANFLLFNRLAVCFDVVGRTCESFDSLKFENIRKILSTDERIGEWGLFDSLSAGGSCLIKDARSLSHQLQTAGQEASLVNEIYLANRRQLELFLGRAEREANFNFSGKTVAVLGLAFKRDTNDVRNSPSIDIVNFLLEHQAAKINLFDYAAADSFKQIFPESEVVKYCDDETGAMKGAEVIIIATDWPQFRELADQIMASSKNKPLIMDGRRMLTSQFEQLAEKGYDIIAVGSPFIKGKK